jgi:hypothetical protein
MAAVIKGLGVVWSVGAIDFTAVSISASVQGTGHLTQSAAVERTSEVTRVKNNAGTIKVVIFHGNMKTVRLTVVPSGSSVANARTSSANLTPTAGTKVTITDDAGTIIDDSYNILSASENRTVDGVATIDLVLEASDESVDLHTVIS